MVTTSLEPTSQERKADRWVTFAGLMLILAGVLDVFDGLWALTAEDTTFDALFWDDNIEARGWFWLILGIVVVATGFAVFARERWAVFAGIAVTLVAAMLNFLWIFVYPLATAVIVTLNVLVAYALTMYGLEEERPARS
jgi:hypothetical protein